MSNITDMKLLNALKEFDEALEKTEEQMRLNAEHEKTILTVFNKYDMLFAGKYGRNRRTINKQLSWDEVQRNVKLIHAEDSQPVKTGFLGIGGMTKNQYLELTDKMNLVLSNLERWKKQWEGYLLEKRSAVIELLDEYEAYYQKYIERKGLSTDLVMGFAQLPIPTRVWNSYYFPHENYACLKKGKLQVILTNSLKNAVPVLVTYQNVDAIATIDDFVCSLCEQIIVQLSPNEYTIEYFDYLMGGMGLRAFAMLQDIPYYKSSRVELKLYPKGMKPLKLVCDEKQIEELGKELETYIQKVGELTRGQGTVLDYAAAQGKDVPYRIVIFKNVLPTQMALIQRLFLQGARNAILPIVITQTEEKTYHNNIDSVLQASGVRLQKFDFHEGTMLHDDKVGKYVFMPRKVSNGHLALVQRLCDELSKPIEQDNKFSTWFGKNYEYGQYCSTVENRSGGVEGKITVPYAISDIGEMMSFELGSADYAHGMLSGATGSGKSTLLQMIIGSIIMNYKPTDVQMWLVDYKLVEFSIYLETKCPHITFVGCVSSPEFTRAFLDRVYEEYQRRLKILMDDGVRNIDAYRVKNGLDSMPRLIIIVDEFHVMAQHVAEDMEYRRKLENILSEVRAVGICCLFSDQAILDGLKGLTDKGKKQMRMRLAMSNVKEEMKATLDYPIEEKLVHSMVRGDVLALQKEHGETSNVFLDKQKVVYIKDQDREDILEQSIVKYGVGANLLRIDGNKTETISWELADSYETAERNKDKRRFSSFYLGLPASFEKVFTVRLYRDFDENIVVTNSTPISQKRFVLDIISSFLHYGKGDIYIMADGNDVMYLEAEETLKYLADIDRRLHVAEGVQQICKYTEYLINELEDRRIKKPEDFENDLVIWIGVPSIIKHFSRLSEKKNVKKNKNAILCDSIEDKFMNLFPGMEFENGIEKESDVEKDAISYNAIGDFKKLQSDGSAQGIFQMICLSNVGAIANISTDTERYIYQSKNYKYKFSEKLGRELAFEYYGTRTFMDEWCQEDERKDEVVPQMVCYDGMSARFFTPYLNEDEVVE